ncbi:hypothetical protein [Granulicella sp. S190]|uniref:hypothetical protein n=1 Tax=Granulicella sp. S190 TaxID=1747226 RepID=UPI00131B92E5|nr:hypothetical protein [Granulicella sp. S190]
MTDQEQRWLTLYLAKKAKSLYRENLALRMLVEKLKEIGYRDVDEILDSAKGSPEAESAANAFDQAIDSRMPPFLEADEDQAFGKWLQDYGFGQGTPN